MLWSSVYEFFVINVFGGWLEGGASYGGALGMILDTSDNVNYDLSTTMLYLEGYKWADGSELYPCAMSLGNYLSMIATIITMVIIVILCALFIGKIIKLVGGLLR